MRTLQRKADQKLFKKNTERKLNSAPWKVEKKMIKLRKNKPVTAPLEISKEVAVWLEELAKREANKLTTAETPRGGSERGQYFTDVALAFEAASTAVTLRTMVMSGLKIQGVK
jgi:hypothetical protein